MEKHCTNCGTIYDFTKPRCPKCGSTSSIASTTDFGDLSLYENYEAAANHVNIGAAYFFKGDLHGAIREYRKALDLNPDSAVAHSNIGAALFKIGKTSESISHLETALELDPMIEGTAELLEQAKQSLHGKKSINYFIVRILDGVNLFSLFSGKKERANKFLKKGDTSHNFEEKITYYVQSLRLDPNRDDSFLKIKEEFRKIGYDISDIMVELYLTVHFFSVEYFEFSMNNDKLMEAILRSSKEEKNNIFLTYLTDYVAKKKNIKPNENLKRVMNKSVKFNKSVKIEIPEMNRKISFPDFSEERSIMLVFWKLFDPKDLKELNFW